MNRFDESTAGQLVALAGAVPLATAACVAWNTGAGMVVIIASVFVGILFGIVGLGLAVEEHPGYALAGVLVLPPALFLYTPLVHFAATVFAIRLAMGLGAVALLGVASKSVLARTRVAVSSSPIRHPA